MQATRYRSSAACASRLASQTHRPSRLAGLKKLGGVFRKGLHLGKDSPPAKSQDLPRDSAEEGAALGERDFRRKSSSEQRVRFSMDDGPREIVE